MVCDNHEYICTQTYYLVLKEKRDNEGVDPFTRGYLSGGAEFPLHQQKIILIKAHHLSHWKVQFYTTSAKLVHTISKIYMYKIRITSTSDVLPSTKFFPACAYNYYIGPSLDCVYI